MRYRRADCLSRYKQRIQVRNFRQTAAAVKAAAVWSFTAEFFNGMPYFGISLVLQGLLYVPCDLKQYNAANADDASDEVKF